MQHLEEQLAKALFEPLQSKQAPARKLATMLRAIDEHYDGGRRASLLGRMCASADRVTFRRSVSHAFGVWTSAIEALCLQAGVPKRLARERAEDVVVRIEGALVVSAGTGDHAIFARTLESLRTSLLAPPDERGAAQVSQAMVTPSPPSPLAPARKKRT